jgi:carbon storage regulator
MKVSMLVLTRKVNEEIKLGAEITIKILSISENQIKIGIDAPKDIQIYRNEVFEKVKENTVAASKASVQKETDLLKYKIHKVE